MDEIRTVAEEKEKIQETQPADTKPKDEQQETVEQINWRKFREKREEERKAAEKAIAEEKERTEKARAEAKALKEAIDALVASGNSGRTDGNELSGSSNPNSGSGSDSDISSIVAREIERVEREREKIRAEQERREWPQRLSRECADFDKVCTAENLDYLEYHHPEIAAPFKDLPDGYNKWKNIYAVLKKMIPNPTSTKDEARMDRNLAKPKSISTPGLPTGGEGAPSLIDDARKMNNWKRMQQVMRGA